MDDSNVVPKKESVQDAAFQYGKWADKDSYWALYAIVAPRAGQPHNATRKC